MGPKLPKINPRPHQKPRKVRCLGPGPEHYFVSKNPTCHRVCSTCEAKIRSMNLSPMIERGRKFEKSLEHPMGDD